MGTLDQARATDGYVSRNRWQLRHETQTFKRADVLTHLRSLIDRDLAKFADWSRSDDADLAEFAAERHAHWTTEVRAC